MTKQIKEPKKQQKSDKTNHRSNPKNQHKQRSKSEQRSDKKISEHVTPTTKRCAEDGNDVTNDSNVYKTKRKRTS